MSDAVKLEQAVRILLAHPQSISPAASELLRAALEDRPFTAKTVMANCRLCGMFKLLQLGELSGLHLCEDCTGKAGKNGEHRG